MTKQMSNTSKYAKELNLKSLPTKYISKPKNNTPYIEELKLILDENIGFFEGDKTLIQIKEAEIINWITKTIESERERVCMDGYIDGHNDGRWISKKKLENEKEKYLKGFIIKMFGKRCKEYEVFCPVCEMWELCDDYIK